MTENKKKIRKPIHQNWLFWVGFVLILVSMLIYIFSDEISLIL